MKRIISEKNLMILMASKSMFEITNHFMHNEVLTIDDFWTIEEKVLKEIEFNQ